jgi:hypothetical protein
MPEAAESPGADQETLVWVQQQLQAGQDKWAVARQLADNGMDRSQARRVVMSVEAELRQAAGDQEVGGGSLLGALVGGAVAAVLGGAAWGLIANATGYEIGYVAWGLGVLSGLGVVLAAGGRKGPALQLLAVLSSLAAIFIGKYLTFAHVLKQVIAEKQGAEVAAKISLLSPGAFQLFLDNFTQILSPFDALWLILAVITAWRIPQAGASEE